MWDDLNGSLSLRNEPLDSYKKGVMMKNSDYLMHSSYVLAWESLKLPGAFRISTTTIASYCAKIGMCDWIFYALSPLGPSIAHSHPGFGKQASDASQSPTLWPWVLPFLPWLSINQRVLSFTSCSEPLSPFQPQSGRPCDNTWNEAV